MQRIMRYRHLASFIVASLSLIMPAQPLHAEDPALPEISIAACEDFEVTGCGDDKQWNTAEWVPLNRRDGGTLEYTSRFKMLYSSTGVYVLFDGSDQILTATMNEDFMDLWNEDVFECFFWTNE